MNRWRYFFLLVSIALLIFLAFPRMQNVVYADGSTTDTPVLTDTYAATATIVTTDTPAPTATIVTTDTPASTATNITTDTPAPTEAIVSTDTPVPTDTSIITDTPAPTDTPASTPTDIFTSTPTDTPVPSDTTVSNPVPVLSSVTPNQEIAGDGDFTITLYGSGFFQGSEALWNGTALSTSFSSETQLTATVPAYFILNEGTVAISVNNPSPGGGASTSQSFTIAPRTNTWMAHSPEGGIIEEVVVDPSNPSNVYAGTSVSGLFKSVDGGQSWSPINNGLTSPGINALAVDPQNSAIVVATGSDGSYISRDSGTFWTKLPISNGGNSKDIKFDPQNPDYIYVGTVGGLYRSTDGGSTWNEIVGTKFGDTWSPNIMQVAVNGQTIYAIQQQENNTGRALWRSTDGGTNWSEIDIPGVTVSSNLLRSLDIDPANPSIVIFGTEYGQRSSASGVYETQNGGKNWTQVITTPDYYFNVVFNQGNPNYIYVANGNGVYETNDGGQTWQAPQGSVDIMTVDADPTNPLVLYGGGFSAMYKTVDGGQTWTSINKGLDAQFITGLAFSSNNSTLYAATWVGGMWTSTDYGVSWVQNSLSQVYLSILLMDPANPSHMLAGNPGLPWETTDGGQSWVQRTFNTQSQALAFAANSDLYESLIGWSVYKSTDDGNTWVEKSNGLPTCPTTQCWINFIAGDPVDPNTIYVSMRSVRQDPIAGAVTTGYLYKTTDGGDNWSSIHNGITNDYLQSLTVDPTNQSILYLGTTNGVFKSIDGGQNWAVAATSGLPAYTSVNIIAVDPLNNEVIYIGTEGQGVYRSRDGGATWSSFNYGLSSALVRSIVPIPSALQNQPASLIKIKPQAFLAASQAQPSKVYSVAGGAVYAYFAADQAPTDIGLSSASIPGNMPTGTAVGTLTTSDPDTGDSFAYTLVPGIGDTDNASFTISGNSLQTAAIFNSKLKNSYSIRIRSTDYGGLFVDKNFTISITANSSLPALIAPANGQTIPYNLPLFDWGDIDGTTSYTIQISKNNTFTSLLTNISVNTSQYLPITSLPPKVTLYWRVRSNVGSKAGPWSLIASFTTANPPSVPSLVSPTNGVLTTNYQPQMDWSTATVPIGTSFDHYQIQIATNTLFSSPTVDQNVSGVSASEYTLGSQLSPNTQYYWRVRSFNSSGQYSAWSLVWNFRTALLPPSLTAPLNGINPLTLRPLFTWSDPNASGVAGYTIQISKNNIFSSIVITGSSTIASYTPAVNLPAAITLYWRVQVKGTNGPSLWSGYQTISSPNPPGVPILNSPSNNALSLTYTPILKWNTVTLPARTTFGHYEIQIAASNDVAFSAPLIDNSNNTNITATQFTLGSGLSPNATYYWRVQAVNVNGEASAWSTIWSFRTLLQTPSLIAPTNSSTTSTLRPLFDWSDVSGAGKYTFQISTSNSFAPLLITASAITSSFTPTTDLPANKTLYWRVQATGTNGPSAWTQSQQIVTANPPSIPLLLSPINVNINSYEPALTWSTATNNPAYYEVQIATNTSFTNPLLDTNTTTTHYQLPTGTLGNLMQYYWRVRSANNLDQFSNWSKTAWFRSPGQISGSVTNSVGGAGVGGIIIQVQGKSLSGTTDSNGNYMINGVMPGSYILVPAASGYSFKPTSLSVSLLSANLTGKNFSASTLLTVSGKVMLDPRANLMSGGSQSPNIGIQNLAGGVQSQSSTVVSGVTVKDNEGHVVQTDQNGNYTITNALPGNYSLSLTKSGYTSIPLNRSFVLSDSALSQYFMIAPTGVPSTKKVFSTTDPPTGTYVRFSANGHYAVISAQLDMDGIILDLYTGQTIPGVGSQADISGDGRYVVFSTWDSLTPDDTNGNPDVYIMDRDTDGNGIFDELGKTSIWRISTMADTSLYNDAYRGAGWPRISADGRYVVFNSSPFVSYLGETIYPGSCGNLFIYEMATKTTTCLPLGSGSGAEISATGRFISFVSWDGVDHFDPNDNNNETDVYVYDRDVDNNGVFDEPGETLIQRASIATDGSQSTENTQGDGAISADGRYVAFVAYGLGNIDNGNDFNLYLRDRQTGITTPITRKIMINGCLAYLTPYRPQITPDGRFIIFVADAYIPANTCVNSNNFDLYGGTYNIIYDRDTDQNGIFDEPGKTMLAVVDTLQNFTRGSQVMQNDISADGRYILFSATVSDTDRGVYLHDRGTNLSFSVTGRVTDGSNNPVPGVTIDAGSGRLAFSDQNGYYSLPGLPGGTYYLNPSSSGLTFSPSSRAVVVPPNSTGQDFKTTTGYVPVSSLSGRVTDLYDKPIAGVSIDDGNGDETVTDNQGLYSFTNLPDGQYTVTPTKAGYEFHPMPSPISVQGEDIGGINFTGLPVYSISGKVVDQNGVGIAGVVVSDDFGIQATTDANGDYNIADVPFGGYTLTPAKAGYTFDPDWLYVDITSGDASSVNFVGQGP